MAASALTAAKAAEELATLHLLRQVADAHATGTSQHSIAAELGVTQPAVHRMLKKARLNPLTATRSAREIALEYATGHISRSQMLDELSSRDYTYGHVADPGNPAEDTYLRGTWDEVTGAATSRLITDEDYRAIISRIEQRRQRVPA